MKLVYLAGKFRGENAWQIECNVRLIESLGLQVARLGCVPVMPHTQYRFFQGTLPDKFWLTATLELLRHCDAILLAPEWSQSKGARAELREARRLRLPIFSFYSLEALRRWGSGSDSMPAIGNSHSAKAKLPKSPTASIRKLKNFKSKTLRPRCSGGRRRNA